MTHKNKLLGTLFKYYITEEANNYLHFKLTVQEDTDYGPTIRAYFTDTYGRPDEEIWIDFHGRKVVQEPSTR